MDEYPEDCLEVFKQNFKTYPVKAAEIAAGLDNAKCMNVVLFGAMCAFLGTDDIYWESVVAESVPQKLRDLNICAFHKGLESVREQSC